VGKHHISEILETEKIYGLKPKTLVEYGFGRLDSLLKNKAIKNISNKPRHILITPSYGENNLLEVCGIELIDILLKAKFNVLLRPHFKTLKDSKKLITSILKKFENNPNFHFETGIISNEKFNDSICMISDWSGISFEYPLAYGKKVIFIDVPKKIINSNYNDISTNPIEFSFREKFGHIVSPKNIQDIPNLINNENEIGNQKLEEISSELIFNIKKSSQIGADFIQQIINQK